MMKAKWPLPKQLLILSNFLFMPVDYFLYMLNAWTHAAKMLWCLLFLSYCRLIKLNNDSWGVQLSTILGWLTCAFDFPDIYQVYYCIYTIKNFTSAKLILQNLGKHLSWKHTLLPGAPETELIVDSCDDSNSSRSLCAVGRSYM